MVRQISFASPGFTDLTGLGKVVKEIRLFIRDIFERQDSKEDKRLAREEKRQVILGKKIANAERLIKLAKNMGISKKDRKALIERAIRADDYFEKQIEQEKLTAVD
ncbi:hypothetical protein I3J27_18210 [Bradyrhizobium xenonodulans]|uniref:ANTAR domain-containing protein n=1 Tax=Bradyrhizobium xenonodulans TaxID=2736875 RepID=A0ABY7MV17_9BRAD|nr:hypothetical protein [Bradyrhizobium xenonodulans]WBL82267.1 hypothetical protein I3J27_18210 [Bradyrhizobium xenonodulans]